MRNLVYGLAIAFLGVFAVSANGSILSDLQGGLSLLEDNDFEVGVLGSPPRLEVGDLLIAIAEFPDFSDPFTSTAYSSYSPSTNMLTAVSFSVVTGKVDISGGGSNAFLFTLGAPGAAAWAALSPVFDPFLGGTAAPAGAIFAVFDDPVDLSGHISNATGGDVSSAVDGAPPLGFFGLAGLADEFFIARTIDGTFSGSGDILTSITDLTVYANLNVTGVPADPVIAELGPHNFLGSAASGIPLADKAFFTGPSILQLQGALGSFSSGGWAISTDTDAYVNRVVPEPFSVMIWTMFAAAMAMGHRVRQAS